MTSVPQSARVPPQTPVPGRWRAGGRPGRRARHRGAPGRTPTHPGQGVQRLVQRAGCTLLFSSGKPQFTGRLIIARSRVRVSAGPFCADWVGAAGGGAGGRSWGVRHHRRWKLTILGEVEGVCGFAGCSSAGIAMTAAREDGATPPLFDVTDAGCAKGAHDDGELPDVFGERSGRRFEARWTFFGRGRGG